MFFTYIYIYLYLSIKYMFFHVYFLPRKKLNQTRFNKTINHETKKIIGCKFKKGENIFVLLDSFFEKRQKACFQN